MSLLSPLSSQQVPHSLYEHCGVPGVRLPHAVVLNRLRWQLREFPFGDEEAVCVFKTALTFVDSVAEIWGPLLQGRALLVLDKQVTADTERLVHALEENRVSHKEGICV